MIKISEALHISPADLLIEQNEKNSTDLNMTSADLYRLKKQLGETFLDDIESIFIKYTDSKED